MFADQETLPPPSQRDPALPAKLAYIVYLAGLLFAGVPWIAAVIVAYVFKQSAPAWVASHYRFQIRTFWMSLALTILAVPLCFILIGFALLGIIWLWALIRLGRGLLYIVRDQPHPDPATWSIG